MPTRTHRSSLPCPPTSILQGVDAMSQSIPNIDFGPPPLLPTCPNKIHASASVYPSPCSSNILGASNSTDPSTHASRPSACSTSPYSRQESCHAGSASRTLLAAGLRVRTPPRLPQACQQSHVPSGIPPTCAPQSGATTLTTSTPSHPVHINSSGCSHHRLAHTSSPFADGPAQDPLGLHHPYPRSTRRSRRCCCPQRLPHKPRGTRSAHRKGRS